MPRPRSAGSDNAAQCALRSASRSPLGTTSDRRRISRMGTGIAAHFGPVWAGVPGRARPDGGHGGQRDGQRCGQEREVRGRARAIEFDLSSLLMQVPAPDRGVRVPVGEMAWEGCCAAEGADLCGLAGVPSRSGHVKRREEVWATAGIVLEGSKRTSAAFTGTCSCARRSNVVRALQSSRTGRARRWDTIGRRS